MDEQPKKKPGQEKTSRSYKARMQAKNMAVVLGATQSQISKVLGIPIGTLGCWAAKDKWSVSKAKVKEKAARVMEEIGAKAMAFERLSIDERQRRMEAESAAVARHHFVACHKMLTGMYERAKTGEEIQAKDIKQLVDALDKTDLMWRRGEGLPEHGKDYADHELHLLARALVGAIIPAILAAIPDAATSARVIEIVERIDWHRVIETRGKLGPAEQPVAKNTEAADEDARNPSA
jgi:hypothetical protein